jgi:hypothetical protein
MSRDKVTFLKSTKVQDVHGCIHSFEQGDEFEAIVSWAEDPIMYSYDLELLNGISLIKLRSIPANLIKINLGDRAAALVELNWENEQ